jgi:hypothetical protein
VTERYSGKPFLKLLDSYVLAAIGKLDAGTDAALTSQEPKFREAFGVTGSWRAIVEDSMKFPPGMEGAVREVWGKGKAKFFAVNGYDPDPVEFATIFVDTNFPH